MKKWFTLVELLVVITIIGLLASIVTISVQQGRVGAREAKRKADIKQVQTALELCYPDPACGAGNDQYPVFTSDPGSIGNYMVQTPQDPSADQSYTWNSGARSYCVTAQLEEEGASFFVSNQGSGLDSGTQRDDCDTST